jgi:hypothetical protein
MHEIAGTREPTGPTARFDDVSDRSLQGVADRAHRFHELRIRNGILVSHGYPSVVRLRHATAHQDPRHYRQPPEIGVAGSLHLSERGQALVDVLSSRTSARADLFPLSGEYAVPAETAIFINATSIGLGDAVARVPISVDSLRPELIVADVVFNPPETWLIRTATDRGCRTIDGLGMLVNQAVISFKIWTGIEPDAGIMRDALEEYLEI